MIERVVDGIDPGLSARLRSLKMSLRHDMARRLIQDMVGAGDVCVDVGANRGAYTYVMSVRAGPAGRVHAAEPFPANCQRLQVLARRQGNIVVHPLALSDQLGSGVLRVPVHGGRHIDALATLERNWPQDEVTCVVSLGTLDDLLEDERRISFLKCDVEGHEQRVFTGASRVLNRDRPVVFAEVEQRHRNDPIDTTFALFADMGYLGWFATQGGLRPLAEFDVVRDQLAFLDGRFVPYGMPDGYVYDFLFCPAGTTPPPWSLLRRDRPGKTSP